jgi:hypothetical protein
MKFPSFPRSAETVDGVMTDIVKAIGRLEAVQTAKSEEAANHDNDAAVSAAAAKLARAEGGRADVVRQRLQHLIGS